MEKKLIEEAPAEAEKKAGIKNAHSTGHEVINQIEAALEKGEYRAAFRLFYNRIVGILCEEGLLTVSSPYYRRGGRIKEDKVTAEFVGVYEYYYATNSGVRSFRPHGDLFHCGNATASFLGAIKEYLKLVVENPDQDPWEILNDYMPSEYFNPESYLDRAGVYSYPHNCRSREAAREALAPYAVKNYGVMDAGEFIEWYQAIDRVYTTHGFPFACTHAGWFFEGYDNLYQKVFDEGAWVIRDFWKQGVPSVWLQKQMKPYPEIRPTYEGLAKALLKTEYEPILCRLFPFRLTENTLRAGCGMGSDDWEEFTLKVAKVLHFVECRSRRKNVTEEAVKDAAKVMDDVLKTIRHYMENGKSL